MLCQGPDEVFICFFGTWQTMRRNGWRARSCGGSLTGDTGYQIRGRNLNKNYRDVDTVIPMKPPFWRPAHHWHACHAGQRLVRCDLERD
jgi:hypothetical protein